MLRSRVLLTVLAIASLAVAAAPAGASTLVGTESPDWTGASSSIATAPGQTVANISDPRPTSQITSPVDGVVVRWRSQEVSGLGAWQMQILRPGTVPGTYEIVESGPVQHQAGATHIDFPVRIPIKVGDRLAMHQASPGFSFFIGGQESPGVVTAVFHTLTVGGAAAAPDATNGIGTAYPLNADVEPDTDGDGWGDETQDACPGLANQDQTDTDGDGQGDVCDLDNDNDGLADGDETTAGTNPSLADTDGDRLNDGDEVARGTNPLVVDSDGDGLDDAAEVTLGTDPLAADSDGDAVVDGTDACPRRAGGMSTAGCPVVTSQVTSVVVLPLPGKQTAMSSAAQADLPPSVAFVTPASGAIVHDGIALELSATDDHGVVGVEVLDGDETVCSWTRAPYRCTWTPSGRSVGPRTLVAVAHDGPGAIGTAVRTATVARFTPRGLTAKTVAARAHGRTTIATTGRLSPPASVPPALGCRGAVTVRVTRAGRTLATRRVRVDKRCRYTSNVTLRAARPHARLVVSSAFAGNALLTPQRAPGETVTVRSARALAQAHLQRARRGR